jgi:hypothetical protein
MSLIGPIYRRGLVILTPGFCSTLCALCSDVSAEYRSLYFHPKQRIPQRLICRKFTLKIHHSAFVSRIYPIRRDIDYFIGKESGQKAVEILTLRQVYKTGPDEKTEKGTEKKQNSVSHGDFRRVAEEHFFSL